MKKYIKNLAKLSMVVVSAVALFFYSFNTNAQQEPGCEVTTHMEAYGLMLIDGYLKRVCHGTGDDCMVSVLECDQQ